MHSMLVAPGDRRGERGREGALRIWRKKEVFRHGLKDGTEDELVFSAGGRLFQRPGAAFLNE